MHYYQFNIGDYISHTDHLSPIQDIAYRRLLDKLYLTEKPIPLEISSASRFIRMAEHSCDVQIVLDEFFIKTAKGWTNKRAEKEIADFQSKSEKSSAAAKKRWGNRSNAAPNGEY